MLCVQKDKSWGLCEMLRAIMQEVLSPWVCQEEKSLYGATQFRENQVFGFLWIALTTKNNSSNWVQKEKEQGWNH